jgi:KaiC/GvpD/RAD55 family RecA-like ATPase
MLDLALGIGGWPVGDLSVIAGPTGSGKTTLAKHAVAEALMRSARVAFVTSEKSVSPVEGLAGFDLGRVDVRTVLDGHDDACQIVDVMRERDYDLVVVDGAKLNRDEVEEVASALSALHPNTTMLVTAMTAAGDGQAVRGAINLEHVASVVVGLERTEDPWVSFAAWAEATISKSRYPTSSFRLARFAMEDGVVSRDRDVTMACREIAARAVATLDGLLLPLVADEMVNALALSMRDGLMVQGEFLTLWSLRRRLVRDRDVNPWPEFAQWR